MGLDARQLPAHLLPAPDWPQGTWWNPSGYRSARARARLMYAFMALQVALYLAMGIYAALNFDEGVEALVSLSSTTSATYYSSLPPIDAFSLILSYLPFPLFVAVSVAQLAWLSRSVDNTWYLLGGTSQWSPGWAIGWWFIPFANFVMPFLVVSDLNRRMARGVGRPLFGLLLTWWLSGFIIFGIAMVFFFAVVFPIFMPEFIPTEPFPAPGEFPFPTITEAEAVAIGVWGISVQLVGLIPLTLTFIVYRRIQRFAEQREPYAVPPPPPSWLAPRPPQWGPPPPPPQWGPPPGAPPQWRPPPGAPPPGAQTQREQTPDTQPPAQWDPPPGSPPRDTQGG